MQAYLKFVFEGEITTKIKPQSYISKSAAPVLPARKAYSGQVSAVEIQVAFGS